MPIVMKTTILMQMYDIDISTLRLFSTYIQVERLLLNVLLVVEK